MERSSVPDARSLPPRAHDAAAFVLAGVKSGRFPPGALLPSLRRLASEARVSFVTMWKAVAWLRAQGHLTGRAGQIPRVAQAPGGDAQVGAADRLGYDAVASDPGGAAGRLAGRLRRDILDGRFALGARLPLMKQLEHQYRCTGRTLRRVLGELCADGTVEPIGRGYAVRSLTVRGSRAAVALLAFHEYVDQYYLGMPKGHDYIRDGELHAAHAGVRLLVEPFRHVRSDILAVAPDSRLFTGRTAAEIQGYIYVLSDPNNNDDLLRRIVRTKKPLTVLEQCGQWVLPPWLRTYPVRVIPVGVSAEPGREIGRFLIHAGHRKIAYVSPFHPTPWSSNRMAGLTAAFAQAGHAQGVAPLCLDLLGWASSFEDFKGKAAEATKVRIELPKGHDLGASGVDFQSLETYLRDKVEGTVVMRAVLRSVFERALADKSITAWVAANDQVAVAALDFLREHRVRVPEDISLVSFDDSFLASANQITSYNFNMSAIMGEAFRHCLRRAPAGGSGRASVVHVRGVIVDRGTGGPARGSHRASGESESAQDD